MIDKMDVIKFVEYTVKSQLNEHFNYVVRFVVEQVDSVLELVNWK